MQKIEFKDLPSTDTPINSENLNLLQTNVESAINGVVLYDNDGNNYGEISLNDNVDNYNYLEVFGHEVGGRKIYNKIAKQGTFINKSFNIFALIFDSRDTFFWTRSAIYTIQSNKLIPSRSKYATITTAGQINIYNESNGESISIDKVIGYK